MKLKHLFFSSLLLSTTFVACTNDDIVENLPVDNEGAIALGEGYTINVAKGLESRAAFNESTYKPLWEEGDKIGAAWFDEVDGLHPNYEDVVISSTLNFGKFRSNHPFDLIEGVGSGRGVFESVTNAFAGAYMLYYPYNSNFSMTDGSISVKPIAATIMDCTPGHEWDAINENMFAFGTAKMVPGGPTAEEFKMGQVPVLYKVYFKFENKKFLDLVNGVAIEKIVIEAKNAGVSVLRTEGHILPPVADVTVANYNEDKLPQAYYDAIDASKVDHISVDLQNSDADEYKLFALETKNEKPFIFSILPFDGAADEVTFKIIASNGYVFTKTFDTTTDKGKEALAFINGDGEENVAATSPGGFVNNLTVILDTQVNDEVAYNESQFKEKWEEALTAKTNTTILYGEDLELDEVLTFNNESDAVITVKAHCDNHSLTINGLNVENGNVVFASPLIVEGDVVSEAEGNLTANYITAENITANGYATFTVADADLLTIAASGEVKLSEIAGMPGIAEIKINNAGAAYGKLTMQNMCIHDLTNNGNVIVEEGVELDAEGTIVNNHSFQVKKAFTNNGTFNQYSTLKTTEEFVNAAGAELNIYKENSGCIIVNEPATITPKNLPAGEINVELASTDKKVVLTNGSKNEGTINLIKGTWELKSNFVYQVAGDINVSKDAYVSMYNNATTTGGRIIVVEDTDYNKVAAINVYYRVNKAADLATLPNSSKVYNLIINGSINYVADMKKYNWWLENATVTTDVEVQMASGKTLNVTGDAILKSNDLDVIRNFKFAAGTSNKIYKNATLTLKAIKLMNGTATLTSEGSVNALNGSTYNINSLM